MTPAPFARISQPRAELSKAYQERAGRLAAATTATDEQRLARCAPELLEQVKIQQRGERPVYLPCDAPEPAVADPARRMLAACAADLELAGLSLCWFRVRGLRPGVSFELPEYADALLMNVDIPNRQLRGRTCAAYRGIVFVNAQLNPYQTALTVAHEVRHQRQLADGWGFVDHRGRAERDAQIYEAAKRRLARRLIAHHGR